MTTPYYSPSGRFSPTLIPRLAVTSGLLILMAWLYAYSSVQLHIVIRVLASLLFAVMMTGAGVFLCKMACVRNPALAVCLALVLTLCAWYFHWVIWVSLSAPVAGASGDAWTSAAHYLPAPATVFAAATAPYRLSGMLIAGAVAEFILFVVIPVLLTYKAAREPFCETSKVWAVEEKLVGRFGAIGAEDTAQFIRALEADPDAFMDLLPPYSAASSHYTSLVLYLAPSGKDAWLTIRTEKVKFVDGKPNNTWKDTVKYVRISPATAQKARNASEEYDWEFPPLPV